MSHVVYLISPPDWETFKQTGEHRPESLDKEGFVHCSKPGQIVVVADVAHAHRDEWVLLLLDESQLDAPVRYETNSDGGSAFPHIYGPLTLNAVVGSFEFVRDWLLFSRPPPDLLAASTRAGYPTTPPIAPPIATPSNAASSVPKA